MNRWLLGLSLIGAVGATLGASDARAAVLWAGHLEEAGVPVDGTVSLAFTYSDPSGASGTCDEPSLIVLDGNFVVECEILDADIDAGLVASIVINGNDFGTAPLVTEWPAAISANLADDALTADSADRLAERSGDPLRLADVAAGAFGFNFDDAEGFDGFDDGDQGIDVTGSPRVSISNNVIGVADRSLLSSHLSSTPLNSALFAANSVANADLASEQLDASDLNNVPLASIVDGTFHASDISPSTADRTTLFRITNQLCANVGALATSPTCNTVDDCISGVRDCVTRACSTSASAVTTCSNVLVGDLVFK